MKRAVPGLPVVRRVRAAVSVVIGGFPGAVAILALPAVVHAQQSRMPAAWEGVAPPAAISGLSDLRPLIPLEFSRAWLARVEQVRRRRTELHAAGRLNGMPPEAAAAEGAALSGVLRVPVIPIRYADGGSEPFPVSELDRRFFGRSVADTVSYGGYWEEVSGGLLRVEGEVAPWLTVSRPAEHYLPAGKHGWGEFGRINELREEVLRLADDHLDFRLFDNDGPDGIPDSGDDDGYVDFVAIVYAVPCSREPQAGAIWPHRAAMAPFESSRVGANGEPIRVTDYVIIPAVDSTTCGPTHIGLLAHETGHALGLPDLYDYDGSSQGIGSWGLMGTGSHSAAYSPAHLGAWEKEQLGWVQVDWLTSDSPDFTAPPVQDSRIVYRHDSPDGSGQYVLLENRQRIGSDRRLPGHGLLVWHIDPERGELGAWNNDERRTAVSLIEADGRSDLGAGRRADGGDPFPGSTKQDVFLSARAPDLYLSGIREAAGVVTAGMRVAFSPPGLIARPRVVRLTGLGGGAPVRQSVEVQRVGGAGYDWRANASRAWLTVTTAGDVLQLRADPTGLPPGEHSGLVRFLDDAGRPAGELNVSFYVATPGAGQIVATELPWSWGLAARDGRIFKASYGWDPFSLRPRPRLLELREGATHPGTATRLPADALYAPLLRPDGSAYVLARAQEQNFLYRMNPDGEVEVVAARFGTEPAYGTALMPDGAILVADFGGTIHRITSEGDVSIWAMVESPLYQIAADASGMVYAATLNGEILRLRDGEVVSTLATGFGRGRLVALAATADGDVYAAERGGGGRIMRFRAGGGREIVYQDRGAQYYGVAVEDDFVYALDLRERKLLRIAN
jgi:M6 family metalloprotease-like protein